MFNSEVANISVEKGGVLAEHGAKVADDDDEVMTTTQEPSSRYQLCIKMLINTC